MRCLALLLPLLLLAGAARPADERVFMVTGFDRVRVDGPFDVEIRAGLSPRASATGDTRALARLSVRVEGGTLIVGTGSRGWDLKPGEAAVSPRITLTAVSLRAVQITGGGRVRAEGARAARVDLGLNGAGALDVAGIDAQDVNLMLTGTGAVTLAGRTMRARIRSNGAGGVDGGGLDTGDAVVVAESAGDTRLAVRYTARVMALGGGTVRILGKPECRISGPGPVECAGKIVRN